MQQNELSKRGRMMLGFSNQWKQPFSLICVFLFAPSSPAWAQEPNEIPATSPFAVSPARAKCYEQNLKDQDPRGLFKCIEPLAASGDANARVDIGYFLFNWLGAVRDPKRAADVWELAAAQGNPTAMTNLAIIFATGSGRPRDFDKANSLRSASARLLGTTVPPLQIAGRISGSDYPQSCAFFALKCKWVGETIVARFTVEADGSVKSCQGIGESDMLKQATCELIQKRFRFLPANSKTGEPVSFEKAQRVTWSPPPQRPDLSAPAKLVAGELTAGMVPVPISSAESGPVELKLALRLDPFGRITGCKATGGAARLAKWACQQAPKKLRIEPGKGTGGRNTESNLELAFQLHFTPVAVRGQTTSIPAPFVQNAQQPAAPKSPEPQNDAVDANLETAISRCKRIGFKEGEASFRECVLEQIRLLSANGSNGQSR